jgi:hypothetical protein
MDVIQAQIEAIDSDLDKLELFGRGFKIGDIKGIDAKVILALSSWSVAVEERSKWDSSEAVIDARIDAALASSEVPRESAFEAGEEAVPVTASADAVFPLDKYDDLFTATAKDNEALCELKSHATEIPVPAPFRSLPPTPSSLAISPIIHAARSKLFTKKKPTRTSSAISRAPQAVPTTIPDDKIKATTVNLIWCLHHARRSAEAEIAIRQEFGRRNDVPPQEGDIDDCEREAETIGCYGGVEQAGCAWGKEYCADEDSESIVLISCCISLDGGFDRSGNKIIVIWDLDIAKHSATTLQSEFDDMMYE